jgi:WD40 repeat protein
MLLERSIWSARRRGRVRLGWANHKNLVRYGSLANSGLLHISPDGSFMALGDSDASLSLWDLRPLDIPDLFTIPFARSTPNHLVILNLLDEDIHPLPRALRNTLRFMERLLRHRFRYDIEISEVASIKAGDYDIEIE